MKLDSILEMWKQDSDIKREDLDNESLRTAKLHQKYHEVYTRERLVLRELEAKMKMLKLDKYEFLTQGPTRETEAKGWVLPPIGKILKANVDQYLDADKDIIDMNLRIGLQHEKLELLSSIIKMLMNRNFQIKNAIDFMKWQSGM